MLKKLKLLKKPLFQKPRWSCDFPPRKTRVAQKHRAISRQEKIAFSTPVGLSWHSPPPPRDCADGRTDGCTDGRSRDHYVTTKISRLDRLPNFLSNGAPLAGFARRLRYKHCGLQFTQGNKSTYNTLERVFLTTLRCTCLLSLQPNNTAV